MNTPTFTTEQLRDWQAFARVQATGQHNMLSVGAMRAVGLSHERHAFVIANYDALQRAVRAAPPPPPEPNVTCPVCAGRRRKPYRGDPRHASITAGYDAQNNTVECPNCGGATMMGRATGLVRINPLTGLGCTHSFAGKRVGRCLTRYTCTHDCGTTFDIDSGD